MSWMIAHLLLTTALLVVVAVGCVISILSLLHRVYAHEPTRPQFGGFLATLVITVLFSVFLNNLFALKRDRDNRLRSLRDQHYAQLRPLLRSESAKLKGIADQISNERRISDPVQTSTVAKGDLSSRLWPEVMSPDL